MSMPEATEPAPGRVTQLPEGIQEAAEVGEDGSHLPPSFCSRESGVTPRR